MSLQHTTECRLLYAPQSHARRWLMRTVLSGQAHSMLAARRLLLRTTSPQPGRAAWFPLAFCFWLFTPTFLAGACAVPPSLQPGCSSQHCGYAAGCLQLHAPWYSASARRGRCAHSVHVLCVRHTCCAARNLLSTVCHCCCRHTPVCQRYDWSDVVRL